MKKIYSSKETAEYLSIPEGTLRTSRSSGLLYSTPAPKFKKLGKKIFYLKTDLDAWIDAMPTYSNTSEY